MKNFLKRFLSTILTLIMLSSCMVIANVGTVSAAALTKWSVTAGSFYQNRKQVYSNATARATSPIYLSDGTVIAINSRNNYYQKYRTFSSNVSNDTGKLWEYEMRLKSDRAISITPVTDGEITFYWYDTGTRYVTVGSNLAVDAVNNTVTSSTAPCKAGEEFIISTTGSNVVLLEIGFEYAKATDYSWTLDDSDITLSLNGDLSLNSTETIQIINSLNYSGTDYALRAGYSTLTENNVEIKGTNIIVKPQDSWFTSAKESISGSAFLNASDLDGVYGSGDILGTYFELYCSGSGTANTDSPKFSNYGDIEYTKRLCLQGTKRDIMFTTTGPALVQVVFASNSSDSRSCIIAEMPDSSNTDEIIASADSAESSSTPSVLTASLAEAGTYFIYGSSNINIYSINVVADAEFTAGSKENPVGAYVNDSDSYVLSVISESESESGDTLKITDNNKVIDTAGTVYYCVSIDNFVFTASDIAEDAAYIYAARFGSSSEDAADTIINNVTAAVS